MEKKYLVPALERGMKLLELLARHPEGLAMPDMDELGLPSASLYRMLVTLVETGYAVRDDRDKYRLSRKLLSLGYHSVDESGIVEHAAGPMRKLRDECGETVTLSVFYGNEGVVIEQIASTLAVKVTVRIGHHFPLHTAAPGKAVMAFLPDEERKRLLKSIKYTVFNEKTITGARQMEKELEDVRKDGIAFDRGEELEEIRCVAAPVFDRRNYPVAAICVSGPFSRLNSKNLNLYGNAVRKAAAEISALI